METAVADQQAVPLALPPFFIRNLRGANMSVYGRIIRHLLLTLQCMCNDEDD